jgi:hypothetical protein
VSAEKPPRRCPVCRRPVDPDDPTTITAYEQKNLPTFGESVDLHDGFNYDFHAACFPSGSPAWRVAED